MTEMVTSGSMSGVGRRSDGLLGESGYERRCSFQAPPVLHATAPSFDSTRQDPLENAGGDQGVDVGIHVLDAGVRQDGLSRF